MFLQTGSIEWAQNYRKLDIYVNNYYANVIKSIKITSNLKQNRLSKIQNKEKQKNSFPKE